MKTSLKLCLISSALLFLCYCDKEIKPAFKLLYKSRTVVVEDTFRILIIGNSITIHPPLPEIGWNDYWGMAASSKENDFVHKFFERIKAHAKVEGKASMRFDNVASFESGFIEFDQARIEKHFSTHKNFNPHLIIFRWGDNVTDSTATRLGFEQKFSELINYFETNRLKRPMIMISGTWYPKARVTEHILSICEKNEIPFVSLEGLRWIPGLNAEKGKFTNGGVASHPSDQGMQVIADSLYNGVNKLIIDP